MTHKIHNDTSFGAFVAVCRYAVPAQAGDAWVSTLRQWFENRASYTARNHFGEFTLSFGWLGVFVSDMDNGAFTLHSGIPEYSHKF